MFNEELEVVNIKKNELQQLVIKEFWNMVSDNQDACMVQWDEENKSLMLYIELNYDGMQLLNKIAETLDVEDSIMMSLHTNDIMIDAFNFIDGYGLLIEELWEERLESLREE